MEVQEFRGDNLRFKKEEEQKGLVQVLAFIISFAEEHIVATDGAAFDSRMMYKEVKT